MANSLIGTTPHGENIAIHEADLTSSHMIPDLNDESLFM